MIPKRTLVIGDIHGSFKGLEQVLERSGFDLKKDKLIVLGDYVDGWPDSALVVEKLIQIQEQAVHKPVYILGNHDAMCRPWILMGHMDRNNWIPQGGKATVDSYVRTGFLLDQRHRDFFDKLVPFYVDSKNRGFVHGGFSSPDGLGNEDYDSIYYWDRFLWIRKAMSQHNLWKKDPSKCWKGFHSHSEIFIGHTTTGSFPLKKSYPEYNDPNQPKNGGIVVPMNRCNVWNLDTGGGMEGRVTIMDVDTKEYWQSDYCKELYSSHKHR